MRSFGNLPQPVTKRQPSGAPLSGLADHIEAFPVALTAARLAELLSVSEMTIYRHAKQNRIPSFRVGGAVRFDPQAIATWLRHKMP